MNTSDYIELLLLARQAGAGSAMNFVGLVFAYFVMVYFVGTRLTTFQIWIVSAVYTVFLTFPMNGAIQDFRTTNALAADFHANFPVEASNFIAETPTLWQFFVVAAIAAWLLSIAFAVNTRRSVASDEDAQ
jgi:Na+/melibiose symporter-like transporter